jgi:hypothetical protein
MKKKIIYLFGSGASHAVINSIDPTKQFLTSDIRQRIEEIKKQNKARDIPTDIWNELMDPNVDIEHLISILETNYHYYSTQKIREYYHDAIIVITKEILENIGKPAFKPNLYSILFDLHSVRGLPEKVKCLMTLNYEDILEQALKSHLNVDTDYIIDRRKTEKGARKIPLLKLHGSFNWKNTRPITVKEANKMQSKDALWIPPGLDKKKETYPFNILWGKAFDYLMTCDTLRVIGCSLSRNDWGLIPMIYIAMRLSNKKQAFEIEIIDFFDVGEKIKKNYPYLNIKSICDVKEFKDYLIDVYSLNKTEPIPEYVKHYISSEASKKINIFEWWLKSKRFNLRSNGINIKTRKKYFENFN